MKLRAAMMRTSLETGTEQLKCEVENGVATITLNRPDKRNALSNELTPAAAGMLPTGSRSGGALS
jgi:2-(1,2-epoxy-1,2-dihydrophenyl)acetyl-CoA isomerase